MKGFKKITLKWFTTKKKTSLQWFQRRRYGKYEQVSVLGEELESDKIEVCLAAELEFSMHCDHCAIDVRNCCIREKGVENVVLDKEKTLVKVEGRFNLERLINVTIDRLNLIVTLIGEKMEDTQEQDERVLQSSNIDATTSDD